MAIYSSRVYIGGGIGVAIGLDVKPEPHPFRVFGRETMGVLPLLNFVNLVVINKASAKTIAINLTVLLAVIVGAWSLTQWLRNSVQWIAMGAGVYCMFTWTQTLIIRSPEVFSAIFKNRTIMLICGAIPCASFVAYGSNFFAIPNLLRAHHVSKAEIGTVIGLTAAVAAWMGISIGGLVADKLKERWEHGRLLIGLFCTLATIPFAAGVYFSFSLSAVYVYNFFAMFFSPMFIGTSAEQRPHSSRGFFTGAPQNCPGVPQSGDPRGTRPTITTPATRDPERRESRRLSTPIY
jgi:hypothetical protein